MVMVNIKAVFIIYIQRIKGPLGLYIPLNLAISWSKITLLICFFMQPVS